MTMTAAGQLYSDEAVSRHLAHLEELSMRQQARLHEIELRAERLAAQERSLGERMREAGTAADALAAREQELAERERRLADAHDMIAKAEDWQLELAELERALDERTLAFGRAAAELDEREQRVRGLEMRETMLEHRIEEVAVRESAATFSEAAAESWLAERADHERRLVELDADADRRCSELEEREAAAHARSREVDLAAEEVRRRGAVVAHRETRLQSRATRLAHGETALSHSERAVRELLTQAEAALESITDAELREEALHRLANELDGRADAIVAVEEALATRDADVSQREQRLSEAERRLRDREQRLADRDSLLDRRQDMLVEGEAALLARRLELYAA